MRNKKPKRKKSAKIGVSQEPPKTLNGLWSMDFVSDRLFDDRKLRILTIVDNFIRISPAISCLIKI